MADCHQEAENLLGHRYYSVAAALVEMSEAEGSERRMETEEALSLPTVPEAMTVSAAAKSRYLRRPRKTRRSAAEVKSRNFYHSWNGKAGRATTTATGMILMVEGTDERTASLSNQREMNLANPRMARMISSLHRRRLKMAEMD